LENPRRSNDVVAAVEGRGQARKDSIVIGLAGQPNVGKSTIFNILTGLDQHVGNWPGKTVDRMEGVFRRNGTRFRIVDLPGAYSLTSVSEEERVTRDYIIHDDPDVIVMVADASALERNLYLLSELLMLPAPVVLALNMMDVAEDHGIHVEAHVLEAALGLPVVPVTASRNQGIHELVDTVMNTVENQETFAPSRPDVAAERSEALGTIRELVSSNVPAPYGTEWVTLKLLEGDDEVTTNCRRWVSAKVWGEIEAVLEQNEDALLDIASARYDWIRRMMRAAVTHPKLGRIGFTDKIDRIAAHPVWGFLTLTAIFGAIFWVTFSLAGPVQEWLDTHVIGGISAYLAVALASTPTWFSGLIIDGILGGVGVVMTFLPILMVFFAGLAILEDTGYLARAGFVMDRFMHAMGLHGKSLLPLFLGFGCNVPAVMGSRVIESRSGRLLTVLLAPLVPCAARLIVLAFLAPAFFGARATLVSWGLVTMNLAILAVIGAILNLTVFRGERVALIMELPLYHAPNLRTILMFVRNNTWAFLRGATTIILTVSVILWALSTFPGQTIDESYLAHFGRALEPVGSLMGMDWRLLVALFSSFIAKENAIAALGVLYGTGSDAGLAQILAAQVALPAGLAFLVVTMLFIPCAATVGAIKRETRSWRWTGFSIGLLIAVAFGAGIVAFQLATRLGLGA